MGGNGFTGDAATAWRYSGARASQLVTLSSPSYLRGKEPGSELLPSSFCLSELLLALIEGLWKS